MYIMYVCSYTDTYVHMYVYVHTYNMGPEEVDHAQVHTAYYSTSIGCNKISVLVG